MFASGPRRIESKLVSTFRVGGGWSLELLAIVGPNLMQYRADFPRTANLIFPHASREAHCILHRMCEFVSQEGKEVLSKLDLYEQNYLTFE